MIRLLAGDCRDVLPTLPAESVQCVVCSPPYWNLRDYGTALWDGGDAACDHKPDARCRSAKSTLAQGAEYSAMTFSAYRDTCGKCGAVRVDRQIGLEPTPDEYLATMVGVFREVRRVLRRDGTCWVNMGDSYASNPSMARGNGFDSYRGSDTPTLNTEHQGRNAYRGNGVKAKDLLLMPARLALALQADGWWVRSDIIWHKPNPMPESCTDRPTSAHEHVFLISKSARYFYDADAVREASGDSSGWAKERAGGGNTWDYGRDGYERSRIGGMSGKETFANTGSRNLRNVWSIATHAYPDAHFATFPPELAERCIKAGTSERGCCAACGKPWVRVTDKAFIPQPDVSLARGVRGAFDQKPMDAMSGWQDVPRGTTSATTTGWAPGCDHDAGTVPCVVLDPFAGAGTTALVADRLQRDCIGIDLNTQYTRMAMDRCIADAPLLADLGPMPEHPEESAMADLFTDMAAD